MNLKEFQTLDKIVATFDLKKKQIILNSSKQTSDGKPLFEWSVDTQSGLITEIKRDDAAQTSVTTEKHIDPNTLTREYARSTASSGVQGDLKTSEMSDDVAGAQKVQNWEELDAQRDIAFKVMYFFIVFIIGTFGLLFAYFQMSQQQE